MAEEFHNGYGFLGRCSDAGKKTIFYRGASYTPMEMLSEIEKATQVGQDYAQELLELKKELGLALA